MLTYQMFCNIAPRRERTLGVAAALLVICLASSGQAAGCADDGCAVSEELVPIRPPTGRMLVPVLPPPPAPARAPLPRPDYPPRPVLPGRTPLPEYLPNNEPPVFAPQKLD
jgi:hypothetical protein